jgi:hypothetical protein
LVGRPGLEPGIRVYEKVHKHLLNSSMNCLMCSKKLEGNQRKYCSNSCKCKYHNHVNGNQSYANQKNRGLEKKYEFILMKGGKCERCGYNNSFRALTFHHRDPSLKMFSLETRTLANMSPKKCLVELDKCDLLCFNCHMELHENES